MPTCYEEHYDSSPTDLSHGIGESGHCRQGLRVVDKTPTWSAWGCGLGNWKPYGLQLSVLEGVAQLLL